MRSLALSLPLLLAVAASDSAAWPVIQAIGTSPAGTPEFPLVRTTFTVDFVGTGPISDRFTFGRIDGQQMFACTAPAGWDCFAFTKGPSTTHYRRIDGPLPPPALTFSVDSTTGEPCIHLFFYSGTTLDYDILGCLDVDGPVPVGPSSWGRVKSVYR